MLAAADQDVAEVDRDGGVPDADLAGAGRAELDVLPAHHLRPAGLVNADRFHRSASRPSDRMDGAAEKGASTACPSCPPRQHDRTREASMAKASARPIEARREDDAQEPGALQCAVAGGRSAAGRKGSGRTSSSCIASRRRASRPTGCAPTRTTATSVSRTRPTAWRWRMSIRFVGPCDPKVVSKKHLHEAEFQMIYVLKGSITTRVRRAGHAHHEGRRRLAAAAAASSTRCSTIPTTARCLEIVMPANFKTVELED